jgi:hypothetical protein
MSAEEVKKLANEEVDYAISKIRNFSNLFRNQTIDQKHMGIEKESDFYLGAAWATATNFFNLDLYKRFGRPPNLLDNHAIMTTLYTRNSELRQAIANLGI